MPPQQKKFTRTGANKKKLAQEMKARQPLHLPKAPKARCKECSLVEEPFVPSEISEHVEIAVLGEAPGANEAQQGIPFIGRSGQLLRDTLKVNGFEDNMLIGNIVACRPPNNDLKPHQDAIECCLPRLKHELEQQKDLKAILTTGNTPLHALDENESRTISKARGEKRVVEGLPAPLMPTFHPAYLLRPFGQRYVPVFREDIENLLTPLPVEVPPTTYALATTISEVQSFTKKLHKLDDGTRVVCDLETEGLEPEQGHILCVSYTWAEGVAVIITEEALKFKGVRNLLSKLHRNRNMEWWGHNFKYDIRWMLAHGIEPPKEYNDTMILSYIVDENSGHGLKELSTHHFKVEDWEAEMKQHLPKKSAPYSTLPPAVLHKYAARDTDMNWRLIPVLLERMERQDRAWEVYETFFRPGLRFITPMEHRGVLIDVDRAVELRDRYLEEKEDITGQLKDLAGDSEFNPGSPLQLRRILFDERKLPVVSKTPKGDPSTAAPVIDKLFEMIPDDEFLTLLMEYRHISKAVGTYLDRLIDKVDDNGILHPSYLVHGTVSGRWAEPIILLIPRATQNKWLAPMRSLFIAKPGNVIVHHDLSQAELRVLCCEAKEPYWQAQFIAGEDLHGATARLVFGEDYTAEDRVSSKNLNFGIVYGMGEFKLSKMLNIPVKEARIYLERYKSVIPYVVDYQDGIWRTVQRIGYVESFFGRRRRFPIITDDNRKHTRNESINFPIQATSNDITWLSKIAFCEELASIGRPWNMLHDGIQSEVGRKDAQEYMERGIDLMVQTAREKYSDYVPFAADAGIGSNWAEAEGKA